MEVGILKSQPENGDDGLTNLNKSAIPPTHASLNKTNNRNIHSASFGSGSSTCSSNSSSSLSTGGGMAYSPAIRGHRDKFASSGRTLNNSSNVDTKCRKKSNTSDMNYIQNTNGYSENCSAENGHNAGVSRLDNAENVSNEPHSLEDYSQANTIKLTGRKKCERVNTKNMNGNGDNTQPHVSHYKPTSFRSSQNYPNLDHINDTQASNYPHSASPGSNSGKL